MTTTPEANVRTGYSICSICDIGCQLRTTAKDGQVERIQAHDSPALARNICYKGTAAPHIHNHADRLRVPLKRVGERGADRPMIRPPGGCRERGQAGRSGVDPRGARRDS